MPNEPILQSWILNGRLHVLDSYGAVWRYENTLWRVVGNINSA